MAKVRDDEQKPHTRLSLRASLHNITKPIGSRDRVNAAFVHGKLTFLSGDICMSCDRRFMSKGRKQVHPVVQVPGAFVRCGQVRVPTTPTLRQAQGHPSLPRRGVMGNTKQTATHESSYSALCGNIRGKRAEVSRGHSSPDPSERRPERGNEDDTIMSSQAAMNPTGGAE